jgi:hypothetical protein
MQINDRNGHHRTPNRGSQQFRLPAASDADPCRQRCESNQQQDASGAHDDLHHDAIRNSQ